MTTAATTYGRTPTVPARRAEAHQWELDADEEELSARRWAIFARRHPTAELRLSAERVAAMSAGTARWMRDQAVAVLVRG